MSKEKKTSPSHESLRVQALNDYKVLGADDYNLFTDIAALAAKVCDKPISLVSFISADKQKINSMFGAFLVDVPRKSSICARVINTVNFFEVNDTLLDRRFKENSQVIGAPKIRYYAGVPLTMSDGHAIGTLCVMDTKAGVLTSAQTTLLQLLARNVISQLELRKKNYQLVAEQKAQIEFLKKNQQ